MTFLPTDYSIPNESNYMRFEQGANKFRVLSTAIIGWEWWEETKEGRRPKRVRTWKEAVSQGQEPLKHFWAFVVWNYASNKVQILEITQKSIMRVINDYVSNPDWGLPQGYDLTVKKTGDGLETEYSVIASPHKPTPTEATLEYKDTVINLEALFEGKDPFKATQEQDVSSEDVANDAAAALGAF